MAKQKIIGKNKKTDWKFIVLLLGILLVGLSVFVLNQKVTYQSSAYSGCAALYANCYKSCTGDDYSPSSHQSGNTWTLKGKCILGCKDEKKLCEQQSNQNTQQQQQQQQQQSQPNDINCQNFNLTTCQSRCQGNARCINRCNQINNMCAQN